MAFGIAFMSFMDAIIKHLSDELSAAQILFFRSFFGLLPLLVLFFRKGSPTSIRTKRPLLHVLRAALGALMFVSFTIGLREMSLANALAICFAAPFFMVGFSLLLLKEPIGPHRIFAMLAGFGGVLIVLQPDTGIFDGGAGYMLIVALSYALTQTLARKYKDSESTFCLTFWGTSGMTLCGAVMMVFFWQELTLMALVWCVAMGVFGTSAHYLMTEAARTASPVVVSPMEYTALIWAAVFDWVVWQSAPEHATMIGSLVIVASGIYIVWRERLPHKEVVSL